MLLAERAAPTGAFDFAALAQPGIARVLRYVPMPNGQWQSPPQEYAIGFADDLRNANGGVAVGDHYDAGGRLDRTTCGGFVWFTGEQLQSASDAALARQLAAGGTLVFDGLQGNAIDAVRPANVPPLQSYFAAYGDGRDDPAARGHLGDIAILRICGQAATGPGTSGWLAPSPDFPPFFPQPTPSPTCEPGTALQCCPFGTMMADNGQCQPVCRNTGSKSAQDVDACLQGYNGVQLINPKNPNPPPVCLDGSHADPVLGCLASSPLAINATCPQGYTKQYVTRTVNGVTKGLTMCQPTPQEKACEQQGMQLAPNGSCQAACPAQAPGQPSLAYPLAQCCPPGQIAQANGSCQPWSPPTPIPPGGTCQPGTTPQPGFSCCPFGTMQGGNGSCAPICPSGSMNPKDVAACLQGFQQQANPPGPTLCLDGSKPDPMLGCLASSPLATAATCPQGYTKQYIAVLGPGPHNIGPGSSNLKGVTMCWPSSQEKTCETQGKQVGLDGNCQQLCPGNGVGYPTTQCCPAGQTVQPNGTCAPSAPTPPPPPPPQPPTPPGPGGTTCAPGTAPTFQCQYFGDVPGDKYANVPMPGSSFSACHSKDREKVAACLNGYIDDSSQTCRDGSKPDAILDCLASSPYASASVCPQGWSKQTVTRSANGVTKSLIMCAPSPQESACEQQGMQLGPNGTCQQLCPPITSNAATAPLNNVAYPTGQCCPIGQPVQPNGTCAPSSSTPTPPPPPPPPPTCPPGYSPLASGSCCLSGQVNGAGMCCPRGQQPVGDSCASGTGGTVCEPGTVRLANGQCCDRVHVQNGQCVQNVTPPPPPCPPGEVRDRNGNCVRPPSTCPPGEVRDRNGDCVRPVICRPGEVLENGRCVPRPSSTCRPGEVRDRNGECVRPVICRHGQVLENGRCVWRPSGTACPLGAARDRTGRCVWPVICGPGQTLVNGHCVARPNGNACPPGMFRLGNNCVRLKLPIVPHGPQPPR
ncbi:MAG TPA: hypothetical protein VKX28_03865 [Xanthobacteraceae bacterium]|nr:hypothetical protein [Xanthobacteraceae bacterium]